MQPSLQPHPQPKTLDDLPANAKHYVDFCMRNSGRVTPALFFLGPDGQPESPGLHGCGSATVQQLVSRGEVADDIEACS